MKLHSPRERRGTALITALVCLVIVMALLGHMLVGALRISRQLRGERDSRQCELLLWAGLERVAIRAQAAASYTGEVWDVTSSEITGAGDGQVTIQVSHQADMPPRFHVRAEYPIGSDRSIRRSRTVQLQIAPLSQE